MQINKIKFDGHKTEVRYSHDLMNGAVSKEIVYRSSRERHDVFDQLGKDIIDPTLRLLEMDPDYKYQEGSGIPVINFNSIKLSHKDEDELGAVITLERVIQGMDAPFLIHTPYVHRKEDNETMPPDLLDIVDKMIGEAGEFIEGKSNQGDMFEVAAVNEENKQTP